jgi:hypothetical protein
MGASGSSGGTTMCTSFAAETTCATRRICERLPGIRTTIHKAQAFTMTAFALLSDRGQLILRHQFKGITHTDHSRLGDNADAPWSNNMRGEL